MKEKAVTEAGASIICQPLFLKPKMYLSPVEDTGGGEGKGMMMAILPS